MLRQVVVQNILVFKGRHVIDFGGNNGCNFYSFVGENASGKSALIDLIKSAGNFSTTEPNFDVISSDGVSAKVVCQFEFTNGGELPQYFGESKTSKFYPLNTRVAGLNSWFATDVLKIPTSLAELIAEVCADIKTKVEVFIGYRYEFNNEDTKSVPNQSLNGQSNIDCCAPLVSQFLYLLCNKFSFVAVKMDGVLRTGLHDPIPGVIDPVEWTPVDASLRNVKIQSLYHEGDEPASPSDCGDAFEFIPKVDKSHFGTNGCGRFSTLSYYQQKIQTLSTLIEQFPKGRLSQIQSLFTEIVGNKSIIFQEKVGHTLCLFDKKTNRAVERIPEGHYSAFIVAALLVKLATRTILLDEPTRGMHPLQIRRLRRILMRESVNRNKCIIAVTHSPEMVDVERITLIYRFQMLPSGYCRISRVTSGYGPRDLHFVGGSEVRELFFTKSVVWVEGESDKRFFEVLLRLFDREKRELWKLLLDKPPVNEDLTDSEDGRRARTARLASAVERHLLDPVYARQYFSAEELSTAQEACHSCSVLPLGGKKNMGKGIAICRDLGIPYAVICDLDAIIPNSRENSILQQFEKCKGYWSAAKLTNPKVNLVDEEACPACKCIDGGQAGLTKLKSLRTVREVMEYYEKEVNIFSWRVNNGEIEDAVRLTKSQFGKKLWSEFSDHSLETLILQLMDPKTLLHLNPKDKDGHKEPNQEILRCIYFLLGFFKKISEQ